MENTLLNNEEFELLLSLSKTKALRFIQACKPITDLLAEQIDEKGKEVLKEAIVLTEKEIERKFIVVREKKLYEIGWFSQDPYFKLGLCVLYPFLFKNFLKNLVTARQLKDTYRIQSINYLFGEDNKVLMMQIFYDVYFSFLIDMRNANKELFKKYLTLTKTRRFNLSRNIELIIDLPDEELRSLIKKIYPRSLLGISHSMFIDSLQRLRSICLNYYKQQTGISETRGRPKK